MENFMLFLGTGGGRFVTSSQARATGGIYFSVSGKRFILDPGPGSLVHMRRMKLKDPDGILLSHYHLDHCGDANAILDGISNPFIIAEEHCITGDEKSFPCVSRYHMEKSAFIKKMAAGDLSEIPGSGIKVIATPASHTCPCIGFSIEIPETGRKIGYAGDTVYFEGMLNPFDGHDILILNILVPHEKKPMENKHLGISGAVEAVNTMRKKPGLVLIQHFSFWMLQNDVRRQARIFGEKTGVKIIPARDFMKFDIDRMNEARDSEKSASLASFS